MKKTLLVLTFFQACFAFGQDGIIQSILTCNSTEGETLFQSIEVFGNVSAFGATPKVTSISTVTEVYHKGTARLLSTGGDLMIDAIAGTVNGDVVINGKSSKLSINRSTGTLELAGSKMPLEKCKGNYYIEMKMDTSLLDDAESDSSDSK